MIFLSYILTSFNKLEHLRNTLPPLLNALDADDELIITDGGSSDGTFAYVNEQTQGRHNVFFTSEKDAGEAHGFNKGLLAARGIYIKVITDDDVYNFSEIKKIKEFLKHKSQPDILLTNVLETNPMHFPTFWLLSNEEKKFREKLSNNIACDFIGISLFIKRSSLPVLGLFNTSVKCVDTDFTIRFAKMKIHVVYYTGATAFRIENTNSVYYNLTNTYITEERQRIYYLWNDNYYKETNSAWNLAKRTFRALKGKKQIVSAESKEHLPARSVQEVYNKCEEILLTYNNANAEFLSRK